MRTSSVSKIIVLMILMVILYSACKEEKTITPAKVPDNPYDTIDYGGNVPNDSLDPASFVGIHQYIFSTTCAVPGCHDGSFEPDFRTVQSAYNTLVYHKVVKNDDDNNFEFRVVPGNISKSWLHYRITTDDNVLGRMPLYDTLSQTEINHIKKWIEDGAKDPFGNSPVVATTQPSFFGILAFKDDTTGIRFDSSRTSIIDPMEFPANSTIEIWIGLYDKNDSGGYLPANNFTYNKYKISNHLYEFSDKVEMPLSVKPAQSPYFGPNPFSPGEKAPYYHYFEINTANFPIDQRQYFRIYTRDADHTSPTEIPSSGSPIYLLTYFSFVVK